MHAVACIGLSQLANIYSQPDLPTGIFHCHICQIWRFFKGVASENNRLALSGKKHLQMLFTT